MRRVLCAGLLVVVGCLSRSRSAALDGTGGETFMKDGGGGTSSTAGGGGQDLEGNGGAQENGGAEGNGGAHDDGGAGNPSPEHFACKATQCDRGDVCVLTHSDPNFDWYGCHKLSAECNAAPTATCIEAETCGASPGGWLDPYYARCSCDDETGCLCYCRVP
jgi:hypothetical protein